MKKYIVLIFVVLLTVFITACNKTIKEEDFVDEFSEKYGNVDSYNVGVTIKISGEEEIIYDGEINFLKDQYYKVSLVNKENNNKQVILKNDDGVFVLTPALNKSFKFPSNWPGNSSHAYLLSSLASDIINDSSRSIKMDGDYFVVDCKVNHKTNTRLNSQKIKFMKDSLMPKEVLIYDSNMELQMCVEFGNFNLSPNLKKEDFNVDANMAGLLLEYGEGNPTYTDQVFTAPTYLPSDLAVSHQINDGGTTYVSYYTGDKGFVLSQKIVEPTLSYDSYRLYDEPILLEKGVGAITSNGLIWYDNGIEYTIYSSALTHSEMIDIANSF